MTHPTNQYEPPDGAVRFSDCTHRCKKCREQTALCFNCWHGHELDIDYFCTNCGHSWGRRWGRLLTTHPTNPSDSGRFRMICDKCEKETSSKYRGMCRSCYARTKPVELQVICGECGDYDSADGNGVSADPPLCFGCNFWTRHMLTPDSTRLRKVRVGGRHYCFDPSNPIKTSGPSVGRGFGGRRFKIEFADGEVVETNNLWHQGSIPELFKERMPDNARFVE